MSAHMSDPEIHALVQDELEWTPEVDAAGVGVSVEDGVVTLSGETDSLWEQAAAAKAALRVRGVRTVVNALEVHPPDSWTISETDLAKAVDHALTAAANLPDSVRAELRQGEVRLLGTVGWDYERRAAERAVEHLRGVRRVTNLLTLEPRPTAADTAERIRSALDRDARLSRADIRVSVTGHTVSLNGTVRTWGDRIHAENLAWRAPYVAAVDNFLTVDDGRALRSA